MGAPSFVTGKLADEFELLVREGAQVFVGKHPSTRIEFEPFGIIQFSFPSVFDPEGASLVNVMRFFGVCLPQQFCKPFTIAYHNRHSLHTRHPFPSLHMECTRWHKYPPFFIISLFT